MKCRLAALVGVLVPLAVAVDAGAQVVRMKGASFRPLGDLPGGVFQSSAISVSRNGQVVAGWGKAPGFRATRWTSTTGAEDISGGLSQGFGRSECVSDDGTVIVGRWTETPSGHAVPFRWSQNTGAAALTGIPEWVSGAWSRACSADGSIIVGWAISFDDPASHAFAWTSAFGLVDIALPVEFGLNGGEAKDCSANGDVIVGNMFTDAYLYHGFRWTANSGVQDIGFGAGIVQDVVVEGVSGDGEVIVGSGRLASTGQNAFRWTAAGGMESLGELPGGTEFARAYGVSGDGSVIVGQSSDSRGNRAFIWTRQLGMRDLADYLTSIGVNLNGYRPFIAWDVSPDGRWIVGQAANPNGDQEAFIASLPISPIPTMAAQLLPGASIRSVGDLTGGARHSTALALSPAGTHCAVSSTSQNGEGAGVYSSGSLVDCGWPAVPGTVGVWLTAVTTIGGQPIMVGHLQNDLVSSHATLWSATGGYQVLPGLPGSSDEYAFGVSDSGRIAVGGCFIPSASAVLPCAWIDGVPSQLADLAGGGTSGIANGCSSDGNTIAGAAWGTLSTNEPVIWDRQSGTATSLGLLPGFGFGGASAVAGNGSIVVGRFFNDYPDRIGQAFRWSATSGVELLSTLPGFPSTCASGVSGDGMIVVGTMANPIAGTSEACLWMPGPVKVRDVLQSRGVDVSGWQLLETNGVSRDGRFLCGKGFNLQTQSYEGWVADLGLD